MKIILTADQMIRLLDSQPPKFPITIRLKGLSEKQKEELISKIKKGGNT